jgi:hypothetical protein
MRFILSILQKYIPVPLKKKKLRELFSLTALAFGTKVPQLKRYSYRKLLGEYARFTKEEAEKCLRNLDSISGVKESLYTNAFKLGETFRKRFRVRSMEDVMALGRVLYRVMGIDFRGTARGDVVISECFFSRYYSVPVCGIVSSLDKGLLAGLSGGGELKFFQRITENRDSCRALLKGMQALR